ERIDALRVAAEAGLDASPDLDGARDVVAARDFELRHAHQIRPRRAAPLGVRVRRRSQGVRSLVEVRDELIPALDGLEQGDARAEGAQIARIPVEAPLPEPERAIGVT